VRTTDEVRLQTTGEAMVRLDEVVRRFGQGPTEVRALDGVSTRIGAGTFVAVMGASGSGKSTFLQCVAGLDRPDTGTVHVAGRQLGGMREAALTRFRRQSVGFVFQSYNLLSALSVRQNVALPLRLGARAGQGADVDRVLAAVGLDGLAGRPVAELSGGQQQRVALARALVIGPQVVFADEPTGALDPTTAAGVLALLRQSVTDLGTTVVMVTHDPVAAQWSDRVLLLDRGRLVADLPTPPADELAGRLRSAALLAVPA
jgi:putative ABC transport system ATP-binding protein